MPGRLSLATETLGRRAAWLCCAPVLVALCVPGVAHAAPAAVPAEASVESDRPLTVIEVCDQWLALLDAEDYEAAWRGAAVSVRNGYSAAEWEEELRGLRGPWRGGAEREHRGDEMTATLPGVPDGDYAIVEFFARFEGRRQAVETVTAERGGDGLWRVMGYYVRYTRQR